jgi:hypothetical protein
MAVADVSPLADTASEAPDRGRWLVLGVPGLAQMMIVLDLTTAQPAIA